MHTLTMRAKALNAIAVRDKISEKEQINESMSKDVLALNLSYPAWRSRKWAPLRVKINNWDACQA